jgi:hypothetical protein
MSRFLIFDLLFCILSLLLQLTLVVSCVHLLISLNSLFYFLQYAALQPVCVGNHNVRAQYASDGSSYGFLSADYHCLHHKQPLSTLDLVLSLILSRVFANVLNLSAIGTPVRSKCCAYSRPDPNAVRDTHHCSALFRAHYSITEYRAVDLSFCFSVCFSISRANE